MRPASFSFYPGDFKKDGNTIQKMVNRYARRPISPDTRQTYREYNWNLNDRR